MCLWDGKLSKRMINEDVNVHTIWYIDIYRYIIYEYITTTFQIWIHSKETNNEFGLRTADYHCVLYHCIDVDTSCYNKVTLHYFNVSFKTSLCSISFKY